MLQANLYMNAKVYTGTDHYAEHFLYKITGSAYKLHTNYNQFFADNDKMGAKRIYFAVAFDGLRTQT
jgi:hypothetical protein